MKTQKIMWRDPTARLGFNGRATALLAHLTRHIRRRREAREIHSTARMLSALSDDILRDIGLRRGSIAADLCERSQFNRNH
jgi:uncharacterized protein YjiS (DUF1127 family)